MLASSWMVCRLQQLPDECIWQRLLRSCGLHWAACLPCFDPIVERPLRRLHRRPAAGQQGQPFSADLQVGPPRPHFLTPLHPRNEASAKPMLSWNALAALSRHAFCSVQQLFTVLGPGGTAAWLTSCLCNVLFRIALVSSRCLVLLTQERQTDIISGVQCCTGAALQSIASATHH
jgi:hypothetical protein